MTVTTALTPGDVAVRKLRLLCPNEKFSFGYVGNLERWGDDRSFYLWCTSKRVASGFYAGNAVSVALGPAGRVEAMTPDDWASAIQRLVAKVQGKPATPQGPTHDKVVARLKAMRVGHCTTLWGCLVWRVSKTKWAVDPHAISIGGPTYDSNYAARKILDANKGQA
jgi:hypothetical protein